MEEKLDEGAWLLVAVCDVKEGLGRGEPTRVDSEVAAGTKRHEAALGDDHVIQHRDAEQLAHLREALRDSEVLLAGLGIAARMIVEQDY